MSEKPYSVTKKQEYYDKYRGHFEYDGFRSQYIYFIEIENYNRNEEWPLENCPKCKCNLTENEPVEDSIKLGSPGLSFIGGTIFAVIILLIILNFTGILQNMLESEFALIAAVAIFFFILLIPFNSARSEIIKFYNCPECSSLLYNKGPNQYRSASGPNIIFKKLEQIPNFKLKKR